MIDVSLTTTILNIIHKCNIKSFVSLLILSFLYFTLIVLILTHFRIRAIIILILYRIIRIVILLIVGIILTHIYRTIILFYNNDYEDRFNIDFERSLRL